MLKYAISSSLSRPWVRPHQEAMSFGFGTGSGLPSEAGKLAETSQPFGVKVATGEMPTEPSRPRATATPSTRSFFLNVAGVRNARYGAESSTAMRCQAPPWRRIAKATLAGAAPVRVALRRKNDVRLSAPVVSAGLGARAFGSSAPGTATTADTGGIVSMRFPRTVPEPSATVHVAFVVPVGTVTVAGVVPLLNATTASRRAP